MPSAGVGSWPDTAWFAASKAGAGTSTALSGASGSAGGAATASGAGGEGSRWGRRQHGIERHVGVQSPQRRIVDRRRAVGDVPVGHRRRVLDRRGRRRRRQRSVGRRHESGIDDGCVGRRRWRWWELVRRRGWRRRLRQRGRHRIELRRRGRCVGQWEWGGHRIELRRRQRSVGRCHESGIDDGCVGRRRRWWELVRRRGRCVGQWGGHRIERRRRRRSERVERRRRRQLAVEAGCVEGLRLVDDVARRRAGERATADRPSALPLGGKHALGDCDLLFLGGHVRGRRILAAAMAGPGARRELKSALIPIAGIDRPVAAGFAAGHLIPFAVGGGACVPGEGEASAADDRAGEGDLGDVYGRCSGLAMPSTHRCARSSLRRLRGQLSGSGWRGSPAAVA